MLDETALRTPGWRDGEPVVFADGTLLTVPTPSAVFVPDDSTEEFKVTWNLGPEFESLMTAWDNAPNGKERIKFEFRVYRYLIGLNYQLSDEDFANLCQIAFQGDSPAAQLRERLHTIANGGGTVPKVPSDGSD
jgi:hypothetical protein